MEPDYIPSEPRCPGVLYFEASVRPSCYQLANAPHALWETVIWNLSLALIARKEGTNRSIV